MKRFVVSFFVFAFGAQGFATSVGVHGSLSLNSGSEVRGLISPSTEQGSNFGLMLGASIEHSLGSHFYIQNELNLADRGFSMTSKGLGGDSVRFSVTGSYLAFPILAKLRIAPDSTVSPYVYLGPEVSFKLSGRTQVDSAIVNGRTYTSGDLEKRGLSVSQNLSSDLTGVLLSGVAGVGTDILLSNSAAFFLDARYTLGLSNAFSNTKKGEELKLSSLQVVGGLKFAL